VVHKHVMGKEVMEFLEVKPNQIVVDCTVGAGGHSLNIARRIMPEGRLIGIDQDQEILEIARENLKNYKNNCHLVHGNFREIDQILKNLKIDKVDAILYDLGVSSLQLENAERGFSFSREGPLDMRMDKNSRISAFDLVNNLSERELSKILAEYGQEWYARKIASRIVETRKNKTISTTRELAELVRRSVPRRGWGVKIDPATRTFLALRIAVNNELESLKISLEKAVKLLKTKSRICVISFHSLEDRIVKLCFRELAKENILKILTKKPLVPTEDEIRKNPRARSAKLRAAMRV
jgi:16S rRNA (cytosine1402-N4)-methyltransferase